MPRWLLIALTVFVLYSTVARYCDFKEAIGLHCERRCK